MTKRTCFVVMSFKQEYDSIFESGIKKAVEENGLECIRVDQGYTPQNIPTNIIKGIIESDIIIADVSIPSPNVYYELGVSHSVGNKTIIISQDTKNLPFDIRTENTLRYTSDRDGIRLLYYDLKECISALLSNPDIPSNIVQIAGREYFDLRNQIVENLESLAEERSRVVAFNKYLLNDKRTNNDAVVSEIAQFLIRKTGTKKPFFVAICGAAGLGKSTVSEEISKSITDSSSLSVSILSLDSFMMDRTERVYKNLSGYHIDANDIMKVKNTLSKLNTGKNVEINLYDHQSGKHEEAPTMVKSSDIIIVDGIHSFHPKLLGYLNFKIYIYASPSDSKELRFLTDLFDRRYYPRRAFQHAEEEYENFVDHCFQYLKLNDLVLTINHYWEYSVDWSEN